MPSPDPTWWGFFVFGILAGLCPCNSVLCLALIGYVTGDSAARRPVQDALKLTLPFGIGTMLVITPLGGVFAYLGKSMVLFNASLAYALGGTVMIIMALGLFGIYHLPVKTIFKRLRLPASLTPMGTFLLGLSISFIFSAGMMLPLVIISSIGGASGRAIRGRLKEGGIWLDRLLGVILVLAAGYYFYLASM